MKPALVFALALASTVAIVSAHAQTYQWKDSKGRTVISDTPPAGAARENRPAAGDSPMPESPAAKPAEAPKSYAEKEMEFKKRQQESAAKAEKDAKAQTAAAENKEYCERAKRHLASLESGQRMATTDSNGERRFMEDAERQQEIERTRKNVASTCK